MTFLLPLALLGCPVIQDDTGSANACTEMAAASVSLTLVYAANGEAVSGASVTYTVDGGDSKPCDNLLEEQWVCGWEEPGLIEVTVAQDGYQTLTESVEVVMTDDGCHVVGQVLDLALEERACTAEYVPAVIATLAGASGETLEDPQVTWSLPNADMAPQACTQDGEQWLCAEEHTGELEIWGTASGHDTDFVLVDVPIDEEQCHPVTQSVALVVDWLPD